MGTSCRIGYMYPSGIVESIYCHWDGYPNGVGKILSEYYTDEEDVKRLISLGDISVLGTTLYHSPEDWKNWKREDSHTLCYSDRGDKDIEPIRSSCVGEYIKRSKQSSVNYTYLFRDGRWEIH